jgi:hypothetical protein
MQAPADMVQNPAPGDSARARIEQAAQGLLYTSESDYPFDFVSVAGAGAAVTPEQFAALVGKAGQPASEVDLDRFFSRHIEKVDAADGPSTALIPRYQALKAALAGLDNVRVFRIGSVTIDCYVVGASAQGLQGVHTVSIET